MGFILNPYNACTMNKIINGSQTTVVFHVDDLKVSHKDPEVVKDILDKLDEVYGTLMTTEGEEKILSKQTYGKVNDYLGMTIDFSEKGKVIISMFNYVEDTVQDLPKFLKSTRNVSTPNADHLFKVNDCAKKLTEDLAKFFHHYVAKLLYLSKSARPDMQTVVAFLCTRVKAPDVAVVIVPIEIKAGGDAVLQ